MKEDILWKEKMFSDYCTQYNIVRGKTKNYDKILNAFVTAAYLAEKRIALDNAVHKEIINALEIAASFYGKLSEDVCSDNVSIPINNALKLAKNILKETK